MRTARIKAEGTGYYHVMSRAIEGRFIFGPAEREWFVETMRRLEQFCGLRIITYAVLSSHWHILMEAPAHQEISDAELIRRIDILYDRPTAREIRRQLDELRKAGDHEAAERVKGAYTYRMYDLSEFCKSLKQRFSQYYNKKQGRCGPLWNQRFKSILVEGSRNALLTMAAYIDLNAVRAGIVSDPKDYRWCGYGEAVVGSAVAREGLALVMRAMGLEPSWSNVGRQYRQYLYVQGQQKDTPPNRPGFSAEQVKEVVESGGRLARHEVLRCRVRYFSDGLVLGSREFVESVFGRYREQFGLKRKSGARGMKYAEWDGLSTMRDLRKAVILVPVGG
jgi:putative transposase